MASSPRRRLGKAAGAFAGFVAIVSLAVALVWTFAIPPVSDAAFQLDDADLAIGSAAVTRAAASQAVVFAVDNSNGAATDEALLAALAEANANLDAYEQLLPPLSFIEPAPDAVTLAELSVQGRAVINLITAGEVEPARSLLETTFEDAYRVAIGELGAARSNVAAALESATSAVATVSWAAQLAVTLVVPILAIVLVWWFGRRRRVAQRREFAGLLAEADLRVEQRDELLTSVSHRFRTPLTSIYGLSDVLVQTKRIAGLDRELVALINSESANLFRIAEDVLAATQLDAGTLTASTEIVPLAQAIDDAVKPLRATGLDVAVDCPEIWVVTDGAKLRQILRNVVANAAEHGAEPILVEVSELAGYVQCVVVDHGSGLPSAIASDDGSEGQSEEATAAGLGLAVAHALAELIDATLVHSRVDDQTRFTLSLSGDVSDAAPAAEPRRKPVIKSIPQPIVRKTEMVND